ncbi:lipopolysaccharide-responsive and beige-like anchor protein isoform X22 [Anguilla rostrata]|uniref:lipopolysaccharide-responsive and beige-like anchor protein isoform X22 n=1 Tax=Anguilla rostrata TaxID=7938 RepID=UPI0030D33433
MASEEVPALGPAAGDGVEKEDGTAALPLNPGIPIRGIRMKFAVLGGLVEVGEVSNRDIVETVFNLLVGGQFDLEMNFIIQEVESVDCMVELLDRCEPTCQAEVWSIFSAILKKSIRNLQACTETGLIEQVLTRIDRTDCMIADLLVDMLGVLARYSITVKELKLFFSKLQGEKGCWPPHAVKLLSVLKCMPHRTGPDSFFSFPGKSAAAIALPPIAKWPYLNGFTFHTWLRMDPINNLNVDKDKPYLYCFRTSKGLGYSAHFVGGCLIVTSLKSKGKGFQHCVKYDFKPQKWYMVTIVHVYNRWKNSEISCFVNGELASYGDITWLVNTSDTFDKCFLGSSETADANRVFCGQMGAVYLFSEALSAAQILAIYQLGPGYKGTFKYKAESDLLFAEHHKTLLYDGKLAGSIAFTYNPRATDTQLCLESSPKDNASIFIHSPHALMLQDVKAVVTHSVQSAMHSIGGVQVLFPLFAQLDFLQHNSHELDTSVCCTLLSFVMELLKNSVAMQEQILACKGFLVIGYALEKSSKVHVTWPVLDIFLAFARYLGNLQNGVPLLKQLCDHILFNPNIWIHSPAKVQLPLYTYLATEFISTATFYNAIRRVGTVLQVMHTLKYFYWVVNPQDRSGVTAKGLDGPRPNHKEMLSLRAFLLLFVKQLIMKDHSVKEDELQSILNYLLTMHEDDNLMDVLQLLVALMSEHPGSMVQAFDQRNGIRVMYKLLASKSEGIRVQALKVVGYFLKHLSPKRKSEVMQTHGLFSLLSERLMLQTNKVTMTTYNVLFEILTEQICTQVIHKQHPDPDSSVKIHNPQILKVIAALLKNSPQNPESMEVRRVFLSDMIKLFNNSRDNRRSLLQCSVWQEWMLSLSYISPHSSEEQKITEMVYAVFRILLYHAIKYEWGGWRVWVDTLSITHSKVSFEQHKENLARMFKEYQRLGAEGQGRIRTVSGASSEAEALTRSSSLRTVEERAPSAVIELPAEGGATATGPGEGSPAEVAITVSDILSRAPEEEKPEGDEGGSGPCADAGEAQEAAVHAGNLTEEAAAGEREDGSKQDTPVETSTDSVTDSTKEETTVGKTGEDEAVVTKVEAEVEKEEAEVEKEEAEVEKEEAEVEKVEAVGEKVEAEVEAVVEKVEAVGEKVEAEVEKAEAGVEKEEAEVEKAEAEVEKPEAEVEKVEAEVEAVVEKVEAEVEKAEAVGEKVEAEVENVKAVVETVETVVEEEAVVEKVEAEVVDEVVVEKVEAEVEKVEAVVEKVVAEAVVTVDAVSSETQSKGEDLEDEGVPSAKVRDDSLEDASYVSAITTIGEDEEDDQSSATGKPCDEEVVCKKEETVAQEVEPVAVEAAPVAEEVKPVAQEEEPVAQEVEAVAQEVEPVAQEEEPVAQEMKLVAQKVDPVAQEVEPATQVEEEPVAEVESVAEEEEPVAQEVELVAQKVEPVTQMEEPVAPEVGPVAEAVVPVELEEADHPAESTETIEPPSTETVQQHAEREDLPRTEAVEQSTESAEPPGTEGMEQAAETVNPPSTETVEQPAEAVNPPSTETVEQPAETVNPPSTETVEQPAETVNLPSTETVEQVASPENEGGESSTAQKTKEIKIARLDVSSVASDTEKLKLKEQTSAEDASATPATPTAPPAAPAAQGAEGASAGRSTMFRIPEFRWSHMHQRLLTDLLFSIETDVQMWRSHSTKTVMDFVNGSENVIFVHNTVHLVSQVVDNIVMACGGILPLLSAATSSSHELEAIEPSQGLSVEASLTFMQRLIGLADVIIFASSLSFTEIEAEKNMSSGGILRQCLRLVCAMAVRNCLECQQHSSLTAGGESARGQKAMQSLMGAGKSGPAQSPVDMVTGGVSPIRDMDRLLQDMDINRLRAVVFRDIEDSKQAQFLALAVVYFISVLMVSKYRDILEPQNNRRPVQRSQSTRSADVGRGGAGLEPEGGLSLRRRDSGIGEEQVSVAAGEAEFGVGGASGPDAISEALSTLSSEVKKSQEVSSSSSSSSSSQGKNVNVKDILRSLVSAPADDIVVDPGLLPPTFLGAVGDAAKDQSVQFRSFDRSVVVAPKKAGGAPAGATSTASPAQAPAGTPVNNVAVVSSGEPAHSASAESAAAGGASASHNLPAVPTVPPLVQEDSASSMSISERLEHALEKAAPLLREIFVDFAPFLSRTLLGSHGQELLIEGTSLVCMKSSSSVVELVMLLCSQEWQNSIQKNAGLAFIELVNEGRLLSHTMKDHLVRVANEAEFILSRQRAEDIHKHAEFESQCAQYAAEKRDEEKMCDHLIRAAKYRDHVTATQLIQKIINILTDKHGAWGSSALSRPREFWRLDYWEDDLRRRRRFVRNPFGSTHSGAALKAAAENELRVTAPEEDVLKGKQSIRSHALGNQNSESELSLDGDDDTLSSLEDKELENLTGPVNLSTGAQLVAPAVVIKGTLSITASELYFEVDEEEPSFKKIDPKILAYTEGLHGKWLFTEIRAAFSRRYLLQNTALEIFMANRTAVMFNFPDAATVKKVVHSLPRVGVGTNFGLPQTRRISLASPKQLFKASNMTQRWQRREISNFEYLIFLNTISGRTYNDINQYPVFPWVITNYDSEELDLTLPSNYRDLSKPIGALNPKRAAFFSERFETWEDDQVPKFHYGTHYSTSSFTLMWLIRMEPFTTFFLNFQGGKFDHADRTFSSVSRAWRNCQRDTSDVKELIPEFYYLPEMFVNSNNYNLGVMEDGTVVSDVELPPWAKTPEEFVRINRLALESDFVSCQLHQWIDLIFGYKQQGPEASRALNVFYYLTYEGAVNLSSITDPMLREAVEAQIRSFGQTPCQLLIEPHPPRSSAMQVTPLMFTEQMQQDVIMVLKFPSNSPVAHVAANTQPGLSAPSIITVTANRLFAVNRWHGLAGHQASSVQDPQYQLPVEIDPLIASNVGTHRRQITDLLDQSIQVHTQCFIITADNRFILVCGFWDKSFRIYSTDSGRLTQIVFGHRDVVTCLARSESYIGGDCYILSGSRDATLLLWYWNGKTCSVGETSSTEFVTPRAILTGHDCEITCAAVCAELGLVISGSKEGPCLIHSMNGDLLRTLEGPASCLRPRLIQSSTEGHCVIYYHQGNFCVFSVNGKLLGHMEVEENVKTMLLSRDGQYLLTGGDGGVLTVWQVHDLKQLFTYPGCDAGIRSMAMSHDQRCIITGMASGSIVLFYNDFNRWHHEYQTRY